MGIYSLGRSDRPLENTDILLQIVEMPYAFSVVTDVSRMHLTTEEIAEKNISDWQASL